MRDKNRLRTIMLESYPAFEALADLSNPHWLFLLEHLDGLWGVLDEKKTILGAVTCSADGREIDAVRKAVAASAGRPRSSSKRRTRVW
ncbi:MAG: hypothetical protein ACOYIK_07670 [Coriobacteriales bacterium]|jgi:hypothetical protein